MKSIVVDPKDDIYPTTDDYVHGMKVEGAKEFLFVSGTMGLDAKGVARPTLDGQLQQIWENLQQILAGAEMTTDNIVRITSYLRDPDFMSANEKARLQALGDRRVPTTTIVAQTLSTDWLVEIEIIAAG